MKQLLDWLDDRTGYRAMVNAMLFENIPGGSRWRYAWGSTLVFTFVVQMITGFFLWAGYSPSSQTAWESVYYIQHHMTGGTLLRGIHHFTAQAMIVLLALHFVQVVIDGAYRAPREVNFWIGLILLQIVLGLSLTGYLLPWDQKGYWATNVATNLMGIVPIVGPSVQRVVVGGTEYGHHTLTRFFALHAGLLPAMMVVFIAAHVYVFRRHGIKHKEPKQGPDEHFWVDQILKDAVACLAVLAVVLFLVIRPWIFSGGHAPIGAELGAPADASESYSAARPEWYFLFLFQFLKNFPGKSEVWGALYIPGFVMTVLALMPIVGRWKMGHHFNVALVFTLLGGVALLTLLAIVEDLRKPEYKAAVAQAQKDAERAVELADSPTGIPTGGAVTLLRNDAKTQGPRLFAQYCSSCHRYDGHNGLGIVPDAVKFAQSASDLKGFASRAWLTGLLDPAKIDSIHYFGGTKHKAGKMVKFVKKDVKAFATEEQEMLKKAIAAVSAEAGLKSQRGMDAADAGVISEGRQIIQKADPIRCTDCHQFREPNKDATAPDLTGYGSRAWLTAFLQDPAHDRFYGSKNDRMPPFGTKRILDERQLGFIIDWLRGEWYEVEAKPR
jgi:ubiquinol-cytochrome c reductase cytochrome b subunit